MVSASSTFKIFPVLRISYRVDDVDDARRRDDTKYGENMYTNTVRDEVDGEMKLNSLNSLEFQENFNSKIFLSPCLAHI